MWANISCRLLNRTFAILRRAELGFFGVLVETRRHTPCFWGHWSEAEARPPRVRLSRHALVPGFFLWSSSVRRSRVRPGHLQRPLTPLGGQTKIRKRRTEPIRWLSRSPSLNRLGSELRFRSSLTEIGFPFRAICRLDFTFRKRRTEPIRWLSRSPSLNRLGSELRFRSSLTEIGFPFRAICRLDFTFSPFRPFLYLFDRVLVLLEFKTHCRPQFPCRREGASSPQTKVWDQNSYRGCGLKAACKFWNI